MHKFKVGNIVKLNPKVYKLKDGRQPTQFGGCYRPSKTAVGVITVVPITASSFYHVDWDIDRKHKAYMENELVFVHCGAFNQLDNMKLDLNKWVSI